MEAGWKNILSSKNPGRAATLYFLLLSILDMFKQEKSLLGTVCGTFWTFPNNFRTFYWTSLTKIFIALSDCLIFENLRVC